jgi:hypothetical protein
MLTTKVQVNTSFIACPTAALEATLGNLMRTKCPVDDDSDNVDHEAYDGMKQR